MRLSLVISRDLVFCGRISTPGLLCCYTSLVMWGSDYIAHPFTRGTHVVTKDFDPLVGGVYTSMGGLIVNYSPFY